MKNNKGFKGRFDEMKKRANKMTLSRGRKPQLRGFLELEG